MIYGQGFLVPVFFAGLLSLLLLPLSKKIKRFVHNETASIILSLIVFVIVICGLSYFISTQVSNIISDYDTIKAKLEEKLQVAQSTVNQYTGMSENEQEAWWACCSRNFLRGKMAR